jgi:hypothetical protein
MAVTAVRGSASQRCDTALPPDRAAVTSQACGKPGNQFGVSPAYRNYCQIPTGTASANCRPGTRTKMSSIYRDRTDRTGTGTAP